MNLRLVNFDIDININIIYIYIVHCQRAQWLIYQILLWFSRSLFLKISEVSNALAEDIPCVVLLIVNVHLLIMQIDDLFAYFYQYN